MTITSESLSYALDEIVAAASYDSFLGAEFIVPLLFSVRPSSRARERFASLGGLGLWEKKTAGAAAAEDALVQQFEKDFVHDAYGKTVPIERELIDDCRLDIVGSLGTFFGGTAAVTMEEDGAAVFDDAFTGATFKSEDNLPICYSAHLNSDGGNSQSNVSTSNALDTDGVSATRTAMRAFKNSRGLLAPSKLDLLIVPAALETKAQQMAKSSLNPDNGNNTANVFQGMRYVVMDRLTTTTEWFGVDTMKMRDNLIWLQRMALEIFSSGDMFTGTKKIGGYMRYSRGCRDWSWIYGNNV